MFARLKIYFCSFCKHALAKGHFCFSNLVTKAERTFTIMTILIIVKSNHKNILKLNKDNVV